MFVWKKTLIKNNKILFERNTELNKFCIELQNQVKDLREKNKELENSLVVASESLADKKKECKKLKTLLTKNNIEYRKEN